MASAELRVIRRRIRSVESTMKITRAMELISTSRIGKAQRRLVAAKPYAAKLDEVIHNVALAGGTTHPLLEQREVETAGVVIVSSDRGLAGGYNHAVIRLSETAIRQHHDAGRRVNLYVVGRKAQAYFAYRKYPIEHAWLHVTDLPVYADARMIANVLLNDYAEGSVDSVEVFTTEYISALTQNPIHRTLLPIAAPKLEGDEATAPIGYSFEPSPEDILNRLLPRYLEGSIFGILLGASASEHAARRRAMKAATENADELTKILTRGANQARQAEITTEISEIVGGAAALGDD